MLYFLNMFENSGGFHFFLRELNGKIQTYKIYVTYLKILFFISFPARTMAFDNFSSFVKETLSFTFFFKFNKWSNCVWVIKSHFERKKNLLSIDDEEKCKVLDETTGKVRLFFFCLFRKYYIGLYAISNSYFEKLKGNNLFTSFGSFKTFFYKLREKYYPKINNIQNFLFCN